MKNNFKKYYLRLTAFILAALMALSACKRPPNVNNDGGYSISLNLTAVEITVGKTRLLEATVVPAGSAVTWTSSNEGVASVDGSGLVTANAEGGADITATANGKSAVCKVTAVKKFDPTSVEPVNFSYFPDLAELDKLYSVKYDFGISKSSQQGEWVFGELVTLSVLQGLLSKGTGNGEGIYLDVTEGGLGDNASKIWLDEMAEYDGIEVVEVIQNTGATNGNERSPYIQMLDKFKSAITKTTNNKPGYVLFNQTITDATDPDGNPIQNGSESVNAACTVSAATGYLAVDVRHKEILDGLGYEQAADASNRDEKWAYNQYKNSLSGDIIILANNGQVHNRDYGIAAGAFFMYESNKDNSFMNSILDKYAAGSLMMGWSSTGEVAQVNRHALYGFNFTCTNYSLNLSAMARLGKKSFKQKAVDTKITADPNKHYVSLIMTDGDNITWHQNDFGFSRGWYGYPNRGSFKMGWTMAPLMADIASPVIRRHYAEATDSDYFVTGVSGSGYIYPSEYGSVNAAALNKLAMSTDEYMRRTGSKYVEILDNRAFDSTVMNAYAARGNIHGGFVLQNADYYRQGGDLRYYNQKPFLGIAESMWMDSPGKMAYRLNSLSPSVNSANGYTAVKIHCWSTTMEDVERMVAKLGDHIEIVSPGELLTLLKDNVPQNSTRTARAATDYPPDVDEYLDTQYLWDNLPLNSGTEFNFDNYLNYEGWVKYTGAKQYDHVGFSGEPWRYSSSVRLSVDGGAGYSIRMDGSDYGNADPTPNTAIYSKLKVPDSPSARLKFFARGEGFGFDCSVRVRIIRLSGGVPVIVKLDSAWTEIGDDIWRELVYDLSAFKGEEVIVAIEHNATDGEGDAEIVYIDNIRITQETLNLSQIKSAAVNQRKSFDFSDGAQGFVWSAESGNTAGYDTQAQALKAVIGADAGANGRAGAVFYTKIALNAGDQHQKFGAFVSAASGTAKVRLALVDNKDRIIRAGMYKTVGSAREYLSLDFDTYRLKGGAFNYVHPIIEIAWNGAASQVLVDSVNIAPMTRNLSSGYYFDKEYFNGLDSAGVASLNSLSAWRYQSGRSVEDTAEISDNKVKFYGYDFIRADDSVIASKALSSYTRVKNEFNARMYVKTQVSGVSSLRFNVQRMEKTSDGRTPADVRFRVLFIENGTVTVLKDYETLTTATQKEITASLLGIAGRTGVLMIEMDCAGNGDRTGMYISGISIS